jgi:hypothetical protein|nr:MAG TPA: Protein of unknown function (DUF1642) [Caudoviricetes sp.]
MNKKELIERIENMPYENGILMDFVKINRGWLLKTIKQLDEPEIVKVPKYIADKIEYMKKYDYNIFDAMRATERDDNFYDWLFADDNMEIFTIAWQYGCEVEEEKRYKVVMKGISSLFRHLKYNFLTEKWYMGNDAEDKNVKKTHTRKEIEDAGFGEVFNSPLFEVKEVE